VAKKVVHNSIIGILFGSFITLIIVFIGPLRTMATHDDIKDFITKTDINKIITKNTYIEDKRLIMDYINRLDRTMEQMGSLTQEMAALKTEIKFLREEIRNKN
jgi:flagellar motor component MotA